MARATRCVRGTAGAVRRQRSAGQVDVVHIYPILIEKGESKVRSRNAPPPRRRAPRPPPHCMQIAIYGLGSVRDERLNRMLAQQKVTFVRPEEDQDVRVGDAGPSAAQCRRRSRAVRARSRGSTYLCCTRTGTRGEAPRTACMRPCCLPGWCASVRAAPHGPRLTRCHGARRAGPGGVGARARVPDPAHGERAGPVLHHAAGLLGRHFPRAGRGACAAAAWQCVTNAADVANVANAADAAGAAGARETRGAAGDSPGLLPHARHPADLCACRRYARSTAPHRARCWPAGSAGAPVPHGGGVLERLPRAERAHAQPAAVHHGVPD